MLTFFLDCTLLFF